ncbi:hypothetical protein [Pseudomonas serbica]|jgi:hypothetical protein|uniref:hypothetical protein n=1 Tax=Pseudomonas serbica TaxID=2965074 RepID=UPI00237B3267|nr:hypothetical protein [Pseudomonas serbica]
MSISKADTVPTWGEINATIRELFFNEFRNTVFGDSTPVGKGLLRLVEHLRTKSCTRLTYGELCALLGDESGPATDDALIGNAIQYATGYPGLLKLAFELDPDGERIEVAKELIGEAHRTGVFNHPAGGQLADWESKVYIVFKPGEKLPKTLDDKLEIPA